MATMMAAACSHPTADKTTQVVESSRLTDCNISLNGLHFTKSLNGAEKQVSDSAGIITFRAKPQADFFCDPNGKISQDDAAILFMEIDNKNLLHILPRSKRDSLRKGPTMRPYSLCMPMTRYGRNCVSNRMKEERTGW